MESSRLIRPLRAASSAFAAAAALAACSGGGGSPAAPIPAPSKAAALFAAPVGLAAEGTPVADAKCTAPPPDPSVASVTLSGLVETIHVPCFKDFNATSTVPASNAKGVVVKLEVSTDKPLGAVVNKKYGTPIAYTALTPNKTIKFTGAKPALLTVVASPSEIVAPHVYAVEVYVPAYGVAIQAVGNLKVVPNTHEIRFNLGTVGGVFPDVEAVVIIYRTK